MKKIRFISLLLALILITVAISSCDISGSTPLNGLSAYEIAVQHGFEGTEAEWLISLQNGPRGESAYEIAVRNGFKGTESEWLDSLKPKYVEIGKETGSVLDASNQALLSSVVVNASGFYNETGGSVSYTGGGVLYGGSKTSGTAYIITNHHTLYGRTGRWTVTHGISPNITVQFYGSNDKVAATYIGGSATYDIAVLKITNNASYRDGICVPAIIAEDKNPYVGQTAIAIGNPSAGGLSATAGIISVDSEYITMTTVLNTSQQYRVMRLDAAINRGNSGGGVFNLYGELIGIVNAKTISDGVEGMGYALPIYQVEAVAKNIIRNCEGVTNINALRCLLGIQLRTQNSRATLAENGFVKIIEDVVVDKVDAGTLATDVMQIGDILLSLEYNGEIVTVDRLFRLPEFSLNFEKGKEVKITIRRNNSQQVKTFTLGEPVVVV